MVFHNVAWARNARWNWHSLDWGVESDSGATWKCCKITGYQRHRSAWEQFLVPGDLDFNPKEWFPLSIRNSLLKKPYSTYYCRHLFLCFNTYNLNTFPVSLISFSFPLILRCEARRGAGSQEPTGLMSWYLTYVVCQLLFVCSTFGISQSSKWNGIVVVSDHCSLLLIGCWPMAWALLTAFWVFGDTFAMGEWSRRVWPCQVLEASFCRCQDASATVATAGCLYESVTDCISRNCVLCACTMLQLMYLDLKIEKLNQPDSNEIVNRSSSPRSTSVLMLLKCRESHICFLWLMIFVWPPRKLCNCARHCTQWIIGVEATVEASENLGLVYFGKPEEFRVAKTFRVAANCRAHPLRAVFETQRRWSWKSAQHVWQHLAKMANSAEPKLSTVGVLEMHPGVQPSKSKNLSDWNGCRKTKVSLQQAFWFWPYDMVHHMKLGRRGRPSFYMALISFDLCSLLCLLRLGLQIRGSYLSQCLQRIATCFELKHDWKIKMLIKLSKQQLQGIQSRKRLKIRWTFLLFENHAPLKHFNFKKY